MASLAVLGLRAWLVADPVDHFIVEQGFTGPAYVVFGVPGGESLHWNAERPGWDIPIPAAQQFILTTLAVTDASSLSSVAMRQRDGAPQRLPVRSPTQERPFAFLGPRSSTIEVPVAPGRVATFFVQSPLVVCDPCPDGHLVPRLTTREALEAEVIAALALHLQDDEVPLSALDVSER